MVKVAVETWDVVHAEYLHPAHHELQIRLHSGEWKVLDKNKDWNIFEAITTHPEVKVWAFGERAKEEENRLRKIAREAALAAMSEKMPEKAVEAEKVLPLEPAPLPPAAKAENGVVTLNKENPDSPTIAVTVPEVVTPLMRLEVTNVNPNTPVEGIDPRVEVKLTPVEAAQPEDKAAMIATGPVEAADVVLVAAPEVVAQLEAEKLHPSAIAAEAMHVAAPELPPKEAELKELPIATPEPEVVPEAAPEVVPTPPAQEVPAAADTPLGGETPKAE